jgi:hypothetical protein
MYLEYVRRSRRLEFGGYTSWETVTYVRGPRRRWNDNIKMDNTEIGCKDIRWICLALDHIQWQTLAFEC